MALKFLNKKGWHTGSLRNIENVWKAEQKQEAEQKKLDELRKQIQEERERSEFRLLQEQAGLVPKQERLDFLYESGLAVGKSSEGFKALAPSSAAPAAPPAEPSSSKAAVPGALFEDKPQSANDAWRKLHSDPLLLIRQREKEALDRIKNNPMKMAMIRKSVETEKKHKRDKREKQEKKERNGKHKSKHAKRSSNVSSGSEETSEDETEIRKRKQPTSEQHRHKSKREKHSEDVSEGDEERKKRDRSKHSNRAHSDSKHTGGVEEDRRKGDRSKSEHHGEERRNSDRSASALRLENKQSGTPTQDVRQGYGYNRHRSVPKLSDEERAARLREMQLDAELHEEQRWKRLKKAAEADAREAVRASSSSGKNFLDAAQKSIYGTEKGGSSTIEESVRRRTYYSQGGSAAHEGNAFRR